MKRRTRCSGKQIDVLLDRVDVVVAVFAQPAPEAFERPDIAQTGGLLERDMRLFNHLEGRGIIKARAVLPADHHMEGIGARELAVDAARRGNRLLAIWNLIGEAIPRL